MPFLQEYFNMLLFFILVLIISCLILFISYFLTVRMIDIEKHLPYECGFDPFSDSRYFLSIQFYFIAVLFIVFDIEIALLFPWTLSLKTLNNFGYNSMFFFLIILVLGFVFEWSNDGLKWSKIKLN